MSEILGYFLFFSLLIPALIFFFLVCLQFYWVEFWVGFLHVYVFCYLSLMYYKDSATCLLKNVHFGPSLHCALMRLTVPVHLCWRLSISACKSCTGTVLLSLGLLLPDSLWSLCFSYSVQTDGKLEIPVHQGLFFCSSEFLMAYKYSYHSCVSLMLGHRMLQPFSSLYSQADMKD